MKLKQAKSIVWKQSDAAIVGENGVLTTGLRVRSDIKAGDPAGYCVNGSSKSWTETETDVKAGTRTRECKSCSRFSTTSGNTNTTVDCGNWSAWSG